MKNYDCPHCGSIKVFMKPKGEQTGLYCGDCAKWIKWVPKNEIALVERFIEDNKNKPNELAENLPKDVQALETICRTVSDYLKYNYNPHTAVIITDSEIRLVQDEISIPVKRC